MKERLGDLVAVEAGQAGLRCHAVEGGREAAPRWQPPSSPQPSSQLAQPRVSSALPLGPRQPQPPLPRWLPPPAARVIDLAAPPAELLCPCCSEHLPPGGWQREGASPGVSFLCATCLAALDAALD